MPDESQSAELIESRILNPPEIREIETIEVVQPDLLIFQNRIDVSFLIDTTGSMSFQIGVLSSSLDEVAELLQETFSEIMFSLVTFKDEDEIDFVTGTEFVDLEEFKVLVAGLTSGGGGDGLEAGYQTVFNACTQLEWRPRFQANRALVLISDIGSHNRDKTKEQALEALLAESVRFIYSDYYFDDGYDFLSDGSNGEFVVFNPDAEVFAERLAEALSNVDLFEGKDAIYIANDSEPLEAKDENGVDRIFVNRGFSLAISGDTTTGVKTVNLTIDNSDLQVSSYLADAIKNNLPIEVIYRLYLSNDLDGPQNLPPLKLYLSNVEVSGTQVSGELNWIDLTNAPFPNSYYIRTNFPTLR